MHDRLKHLHTTNILVTEQSGFRKGISIENAVYKLQRTYSNLLTIKCIFCGFAKAFD